MNNLKCILLILLLSSVSVSCVTETVGGFNTSASPERAFDAYIQLSRGYLQQDDLSNTRRALNNASNINSNDSELHGIWGLLYAREGDRELAEDSFKRSLRIDKENSQVRNNFAAFLFSIDRYEDAYEQLEIVVSDTNYANRSQAFENMGLAALQLNEVEDAKYAFGRALQLNANQLRSSLELIDIYIRSGDMQQANSRYNGYLTLLQFYNIEHNARSLWSGIQLELAQGNERSANEYALALERGFSNSAEYQLYQQLTKR